VKPGALNFWNGFFLVDKPSGMTSRDVVNHLQKLLPRKTKIGHAGTLDPLATGVLVMGVGHGTRLVEEVQNQTKVYSAKVRFGFTSTSDDADGEVTPYPNPKPVTLEQIAAVVSKYVGETEQRPPQVSALKVEGQRAHDLARKGADFTLAPRIVRIDSIEILSFEDQTLSIRVTCGKGTYIRSIARDLGEDLGCGGYITELRRERIGDFQVEAGLQLPVQRETLEKSLLPLSFAVPNYLRLDLDYEQLIKLVQGQQVNGDWNDCEQAGAFYEGKLVALGFIQEKKLHGKKVFFDR